MDQIYGGRHLLYKDEIKDIDWCAAAERTHGAEYSAKRPAVKTSCQNTAEIGTP